MQQEWQPLASWGRVRSSGDLGDWVAQGRRRQGLTQAELAEWLGVDRTTVVRLEAGAVSQIARVVDALGVLGLDLVVVPRGTSVHVESVSGQPSP